MNKMTTASIIVFSCLMHLVIAESNECELSPCKHIGNCTNTNGTYLCVCSIGWIGDNCENVAKQNNGNCTHTNGSYICGCPACWEGNNCSKDINECSLSPCVNGGKCTNTNGSYLCTCPAGWKGTNCSDDVDECYEAKDVCQQDCRNTNGSYRCFCYSEFVGNGYNCTAAQGRYSVSLTFIFAFNLGVEESLSNYYIYYKYLRYVNDTLSDYFMQNMEEDFIRVEIQAIRSGSLIVEYIVITRDTDTARTSIVKHLFEAFTESFSINGTPARVLAVLVGGGTVTENLNQCETYTKVIQGCPNNYQCVVEDGSPVCKPKAGDNSELVVGLAVGIPLGSLLIVIVTVLIICCTRSGKKELFSNSSFHNEKSEASMHRNLSPEIVPTQVSGYTRSGRLSAPNQWKPDSDMCSVSSHCGRSTTSTEHIYTEIENFHPGRIYEGAEDHGRQQERSNISRDSKFRYMNPNEKYEKIRPKTERAEYHIYDKLQYI